MPLCKERLHAAVLNELLDGELARSPLENHLDTNQTDLRAAGPIPPRRSHAPRRAALPQIHGCASTPRRSIAPTLDGFAGGFRLWSLRGTGALALGFLLVAGVLLAALLLTPQH